ncbi:hypothetical protein BCR43DRAFT_560255 [Syncephalastrum racemosum]|uniref:Domain of unknown function at the cortex 1 domain-containing protein n=1 Tax=Syncephalastrum racemosum TaxID=13706 RepID=A0A1X2HVH6_SYNRA|nr:hypothetical protein BCR43DRAFT_560255 [Syncephalastrum racemosum]
MSQTATHLRLVVRAGPSLDKLQTVPINNDAQPVQIQSPSFDGHVFVRVRGHTPESRYFDTRDDTFCVAVAGRFLTPHLTADDILFGNQFERPLKLPTGSSIAVRFAQWYDPGLQADLYSERPAAFSPLIVTMNRLYVKNNVSDDIIAAPLEEDVTDLSFDLREPKDRKSFYSAPQTRKAVDISSNQTWAMEFANPYIDFNKCTIKLPGFEINVLQYWDGQPLRYYAKSRDDSAVFFIVEFDLFDPATRAA